MKSSLDLKKIGIWTGNFEAQPASKLREAVAEMEECEPIKQVMGASFVSAYAAIKKQEYETFMKVISPWEREHLLLNV